MVMENTFFGAVRPVPFWNFVGGAMYLGFLGAALFLLVFGTPRFDARDSAPAQGQLETRQLLRR